MTARFDPSPTVTLTLSVYGAGTVSANPSPSSGPASCSSSDPNTTTCTLTYNRNTSVTLGTSHQMGFSLIELQNCTAINATSCSAVMSASRTVSAFFCPDGGNCPI